MITPAYFMPLTIGFILGILLTLIFASLYVYHREKRLYKSLEQMLDDALEGQFKEDRFDETRLSYIESRFKYYFSGQAITHQKMKQEQDKITALISDISHQTKTPLSSIILYSNLLSEKLDEGNLSLRDETTQTCLDYLSRQSEKLQFLIDALIKTSRLETGIIALHKAPINMHHFINELLEQVKPLSESHRVSILLDDTAKTILSNNENPTELTFKGDLKWTLEAFYNILNNAIKYSPEGSYITISIIQYSLFVCLKISDQGMGIPESEVPLIFNRFYRGENALSSEGVGIGLYITRNIIATQGGYIKVEPNQPKGSVFSVYLPL